GCRGSQAAGPTGETLRGDRGLRRSRFTGNKRSGGVLGSGHGREASRRSNGDPEVVRPHAVNRILEIHLKRRSSKCDQSSFGCSAFPFRSLSLSPCCAETKLVAWGS